MSLSIRSVIPSDFPAVVRMLKALQVHVGEPAAAKVSVAILEADGPFGHGNFNILVAENAGEIVGLCLYSMAFSGWRGCSGLFVEDIYVEPALRGAGLGRRLLDAALQAEAHRGARFIKLEVSMENASAIAFYQRLGFTIWEGEGLMMLEPKAS